MKRTLGFLLASVASLFAAAPGLAKVQVVTSLQDFASIADAVGGKRVETFALARGYQDPHFVEPKPSFVLKLSKADLLIVAGLELEVGYLPPLIDQSRNAKIRPGSPGYLDASAGCDILERPTGTVTRAMGDVHPFGNPHYWLDPENGRIIARAIAARLTALDAPGRGRVRRQSRRLRGQAHGGRETLGGGARALRRHGARHVPQLLAELSQALQARGRRLRRAQARRAALAVAHRRAHRHDAGEEDPGHPHGALLRPEDPRA